MRRRISSSGEEVEAPPDLRGGNRSKGGKRLQEWEE
jgi:hypothetical protein